MQLLIRAYSNDIFNQTAVENLENFRYVNG